MKTMSDWLRMGEGRQIPNTRTPLSSIRNSSQMYSALCFEFTDVDSLNHVVLGLHDQQCVDLEGHTSLPKGFSNSLDCYLSVIISGLLSTIMGKQNTHAKFLYYFG